jgi:5'-3' exonuclease
MNKRILFLDFNNLTIRGLLQDPTMFSNPNPEFSQHKHVLLGMIFSNIEKFEPDEVICAVDDQRNWRKKVYSEYKANRKEKRDKDVFPWDKYYEHINSFTEGIKQNFPLKFLQVPYAEADDTIAVLANHFTDSSNIIVTTDSDYIQLLHRKNNRIWNPLKKVWLDDKDPLKTLHIKIISGDGGDNVPGIKPRVGPKTAIKLIDTGNLETLLKEDEYRLAYERNRRLIDWNYIPDALKKEILRRYDTLPPLNDFNSMNVLRFFIEHGMRYHTQNINRIKRSLERLTKPVRIGEFV